MLAESLTQITLQLGLQEEQARELIQQTFLGSALLTANTIHFEKMMHSVASKGGATEAALHVLQPALSDLMSNAIDAALKRLQELAQ